MDEINKRIGVGFGVMLLKQGKILLGKRNDDPALASSALHGEGTWTMPGGKLHFDEKFEDAAARVVLEETGIKLDKNGLRLISVSNNIEHDAHFVTLGFLSENFVGDPRTLEPDEITEWKWFGLGSLPSPLFKPTQDVIRNYVGKTVY